MQQKYIIIQPRNDLAKKKKNKLHVKDIYFARIRNRYYSLKSIYYNIRASLARKGSKSRKRFETLARIIRQPRVIGKMPRMGMKVAGRRVCEDGPFERNRGKYFVPADSQEFRALCDWQQTEEIGLKFAGLWNVLAIRFSILLSPLPLHSHTHTEILFFLVRVKVSLSLFLSLFLLWFFSQLFSECGA